MADVAEVLGVGVLGAGPATQAIHLPTLARLRALFRVVAVMDVDAAVAQRVAERAGARSSTSEQEVLENPAVDVALICSPPRHHAAQVAAACAAGVRAVLCEKPFATSREEAADIAAVAAASGTPVVVGAMHAFDPTWLAARAAWEETGDQVVAVRSSIVLPPNPRFEDRASHILTRPEHTGVDAGDPAAVAAAVHGLVMGLTVHDLPLVRSLVPGLGAVLDASWLPPYGAAISVGAPGVGVELLASVHRHWVPEWTLQVWGERHSLRVDFPPSYVHAGSATAVLSGADGARVLGPSSSNGYEEEWRHLHDVATGAAALRHTPASMVDDLACTLDVADGAARAVAGSGRRLAGARS